MPKSFVDYVLDLETTGKRGWHGIREKFNPPRVTQIGMIRMDPLKAKAPKVILGGGPGGGWTNLIAPLIEKYQPQSELKLPPQFWRELASYDPSVTVKGSVLHDQVRAHVREYLTLRKTGKTGEMKSAADYIRVFQRTIQKDIDAGNTVRLNAYNKGFDLDQMVHEMNRAPGDEGAQFMKWLDDNVAKGRIELKGVEENVHRGMFDVMMADEKVTPRFASSKYFDKARQAGLKTVGLEATTPHYALREMINDLRAIKGGQPAKQVLQGLPAEVQSQLKSVRNYDDFVKFSKYLTENPEAKRVLMGHYKGRVSQKFGVDMAKHVREMGFEYLSGWRQEVTANLLGLGKVKHTALADVYTSRDIIGLMSIAKTRERVAREIMTNEALILQEVNVKYGRYLEEGAHAVTRTGQTALRNIAHRSRIAPPAGLSRLARSPLTLPLVAAAGGLIIGDQLMRNSTPQRQVNAMRDQMEGKIQAIRSATSQWDQQHGIRPSIMQFANQSIFGSGRHGAWDNGSYRGVPIHGDIEYLRQEYALHPSWQWQEAMSQAGADYSKAYGPTKEEMANQAIDLSDYIYELKDADTLLLRKAWLNQNIPLVGPAVGFLQRHIQNLAKTMTGQDFGFTLRVDNVDAPETGHGGGYYIPGVQKGGDEATDIMDRVMRGSTIQQALFGGRATHIQLRPMGKYGRYVGTPMAGGQDLAGELVRRGGAISSAMDGSYLADERLAQASGGGIWKYPEYQAVPMARARGIRPAFSPLKRYSALGRSIDAQAMYSLMVYAQNPQLHGVRDQHAQNINVRSY